MVEAEDGTVLNFVIVPEVPCPACGAGWPNRVKIDDWWKCYNPSCGVAYYRPVEGDPDWLEYEGVP